MGLLAFFGMIFQVYHWYVVCVCCQLIQHYCFCQVVSSFWTIFFYLENFCNSIRFLNLESHDRFWHSGRGFMSVINSNFTHISHRLAAIHSRYSWQYGDYSLHFVSVLQKSSLMPHLSINAYWNNLVILLFFFTLFIIRSCFTKKTLCLRLSTVDAL